MIRLPPRSTPLYSSAASDVYKRQSQLRRSSATASTAPRTSTSAANKGQPVPGTFRPSFTDKIYPAPDKTDQGGRYGRCCNSRHVAVSYTHLRAHETRHDLVCRLLLEKKKKTKR